MTEQRTQNELVLSPCEFVYTQDLTSGVLKTHTGPNVVNVTGQEYPVSFDSKTGRFKKVSLAEAAQQFVTAQQGYYIVLSNPATDKKHPQVKDKAPAPLLDYGQKINIQGPKTFALWPGQTAEVIEGHNLRSNQYLLIRIRDEQMARENWASSVVKTNVRNTDTPESGTGEGQKPAQRDEVQRTKAKTTIFDSVPADLSVGKHYIVRGDEFSFYIPPTGVEVLKDDNGDYVRDAVTLERLEYCILIDENGTKRYERGPQVVFPLPSERFHEESDKAGTRHIVFKPIELNEIQGIHVKVISEYTDEQGQLRKEGEELFIKGDTTPIYFPRAEHSLVTYDRKHKNFATAIPAGEGRYVLQRQTGQIDMVRGPAMLLPDPRSEVIVRRVLSEKQCKLWYPGNLEAERYNAALRELSRGASSTRGAVSEGEVERSKKIKTAAGTSSGALGFADRSSTHSETLAVGAEEFERSATYTEPRTLTLETKYSGVPTIDLWDGYAVLVSSVREDAETARRVEIGPKRILLGYDETLQSLSMSTGKPKSTDSLIQTVYLRIKNNQIGDEIRAETKDHVNVTFKVSLRGDFTGEPLKWFSAENYVKLVCDHVRSIIKSAVRQKTIEELYSDPTSVVRDAILGAKSGNAPRAGLMFEENGFKLSEVELLNFVVGDAKIAAILDQTQHQVVESNIGLAMAEKKLQLDKRQEEIERERQQARADSQRITLQLQAELEKLNAELAKEKVSRERDLALEKINAAMTQTQMQQKAIAEEIKLADEKHKAELERAKEKADQELEIQKGMQELLLAKSTAETDAVVKRFSAASGPVADAIIAASSQDVLARIAEASSIAHYVGGPSVLDVLKKVFEGTPLASAMTKTIAKSALPAGAPSKNGSSPA